MSSDIQWVVLELTAKADGEDPDVIVASIRHLIRDAEVFVPASVVQRDSIREFRYLVDGYAFIKHRHPDGHYFRLEDTKFVHSPLYQATGNRRERRLATVTNSQIETLRAQITVEVDQGIGIGDSVLITSGPYRNIRATVRDEIQEQDSVVVYIYLRSTERLVTLPRAFLRLESKSPHLAQREKLRKVGAWIDMASSIAHWSDTGLDELNWRLVELNQLDSWVSRSVALYRWFNAVYTHIDLDPLLVRYREFLRLDDFASRSALPPIVSASPPKFNVIIDGTELFSRSLTDKQGRSTDGCAGFIRALASYRKRFPQGSFYICWDGSSNRHKRLSHGYKGGRATPQEGPPLSWGRLREVLPMLGVHQAYNVAASADDVMASLVRGPFRACTNVLVTSDRDLLQVVSEFTYQLCPAIGGSRERLYDPETVRSEYGVSPEVLVQLRALSGDGSDRIEGVPGFGIKTAQKVLKPFGNVSALLQSNLAGLTKNQATSLRKAAKRVLQNVSLLTLRDVPVTQIEPAIRAEAARARLKDLGIRPEGVLSAFFGADQCTETADVGL